MAKSNFQYPHEADPDILERAFELVRNIAEALPAQ
jgi:hypothetical protein